VPALFLTCQNLLTPRRARAANKREATQRKAKETKAKVTETTQGVGSRSGKAKSEVKSKDEAPKPEPKSRYIEDNDLVLSLSERTLAVRQVVGRGALAEALEVTGSAVWRFENGRIHPVEVDALQAGLKKVEDRIAAGGSSRPSGSRRSSSRPRPSCSTASRSPSSTCGPAPRV
jgi:hypothetical protein